MPFIAMNLLVSLCSTLSLWFPRVVLGVVMHLDSDEGQVWAPWRRGKDDCRMAGRTGDPMADFTPVDAVFDADL